MPKKKKNEQEHIFAPTLKIAEAFDGTELDGAVVCYGGGASAYLVECGTDEVDSFEIRLVSVSDDTDVSIEALPFVNCPKEKRTAVLKLLNRINYEHRFVYLSMEEETGEVVARYDLLPGLEDEAFIKTVREAFDYVFWCVDYAYPLIMQKIEGRKKRKEEPEQDEAEFEMYFDMNKTTPEEAVDAFFAAEEAASKEEADDYVPYEEMEPGTKMPDGTYFLGVMDGKTTAEDVHRMAQIAVECQDKWYAEHGVEVDEDGEPIDPDWEAKLREREPDVVIF